MQGPPLTFEEAVREIGPGVRADARKLKVAAPRAVDIDDLVQEALLGAFLVWDKLAEHPNPCAAMRMKCKWLMIDHLRATRWAGRFGGIADHDQLADDLPDPGVDWVSPENYAHARDMVRLAVKACKERPLHLQVLERLSVGQDHTEIAGHVGVSVCRVGQVVKELYVAVVGKPRPSRKEAAYARP